MKIAFIDVDTQLDFLLPSGALYVPGAEKKIEAIARMNRYAEANGIPLISTVDAHAESDAEFANWPPHCIAGTLGQRKPAATLVAPAIQTIVEKQSTVFYDHPRLQEAIKKTAADKYVVYGVVTEICVKDVLFGLLRSGKKAELALDAAKELDSAIADKMIREFQAAGGGISTVFA